MIKKILAAALLCASMSSANASLIGVFTDGSTNNAFTNVQYVTNSGNLTPLDGADTTIGITNASFNAMSTSQLLANYDALVMPWIINTSADFDWDTVILPYLNGGGSVLWENPNDLTELANSGLGLTTNTGIYPGITNETQISLTSPFGDDGAIGNFHIHFGITDAADWDIFSVDINGGVHGVNKEFSNGGRMVIGVSDNLYHPDFNSPGVEDHESLTTNELNWLLTGDISGVNPTTSVPTPPSLALFGLSLFALRLFKKKSA
jgi:hypothetical protein